MATDRRVEEQKRREPDEHIVPVVQEEPLVTKRVVTDSVVRIRRKTSEHDEDVRVPLRAEHAHIERVPVGREVDGPLPVERRGDVTVIPVVEEQVVVQRKWVLREEIHIRKVEETREHTEQVRLRRDHVEIDRTPQAGAGEAPPGRT